MRTLIIFNLFLILDMFIIDGLIVLGQQVIIRLVIIVVDHSLRIVRVAYRLRPYYLSLLQLTNLIKGQIIALEINHLLHL